MESHAINLPHYKEAFAMVAQPHTCFQTLKTRRHIALSPKYTSSIIKGIHEILNSDLAVYSDVLDGIPIAFNKPKCVQKYGSIMDENPYMQFDVEVDYVLFQPRKGDILLGRVNKLAADHVGCLVHGTFNASIHRPRNDQATSSSDWAGGHLNGGDEVMFEVLGLNTRGVVSMYGRLTDESSSNIMKNKNAVKKKRKRENSFSETSFDDSSVGSELILACSKTSIEIHSRGDKCRGKIPHELVDVNSNDANQGISSNSTAVQEESGLLFTGLLDRKTSKSEKRKVVNEPCENISHSHKKKKHKNDKKNLKSKIGYNNIPIISSPQNNENYSTAGFVAEQSMLIKTEHADSKSQLSSLSKKKKHKKRKEEPDVDNETLHRRTDCGECNITDDPFDTVKLIESNKKTISVEIVPFKKSKKEKKSKADNKKHEEGSSDVCDKGKDTLQPKISAIQNPQKVEYDIDDFVITKPKKKKVPTATLR